MCLKYFEISTLKCLLYNKNSNLNRKLTEYVKNDSVYRNENFGKFYHLSDGFFKTVIIYFEKVFNHTTKTTKKESSVLLIAFDII